MASNQPTTIIVRLGRVLYWAACTPAVILGIYAGLVLRLPPTGIILAGQHSLWPRVAALVPDASVPEGVFALILGSLIWVVGRGVRYVLAGE
jgi:hypothetical protein